eukprot:m.400586 g.400586  ORF g.400586 m.400586 type:complete len:273 (+) comp21160_c0_seq1:591-1409(+)
MSADCSTAFPRTHASRIGFTDATFYERNFPEQRCTRIPGYTGHIPGKSDYGLGMRSGVVAHKSMSLSPVTSNVSDTYYTRPSSDAVLRLPVPHHTEGHTPASDRYRVQHRPGNLTRDCGMKYRTDTLPGYSGFIPNAREHPGAGYSVGATLGIAMHDRQQESAMLQRASMAPHPPLVAQSRYKPVVTTSVVQAHAADNKTYSATQGVMRGCTKHVPQRKDVSLGKTQGCWTKEIAATVGTGTVAAPPPRPFSVRGHGYKWTVDPATAFGGTR